MLKYYTKMIINDASFSKRVNNCISVLRDKRVIVIGDRECFCFLNKKYNFTRNLNIIAFVPTDEKTLLPSKYGINNITQKQIYDVKADAIFIIDESSYYLYRSIKELEDFEIITLFEEEFQDEFLNMDFLIKYKFDKTFEQLKFKLKGKKVLFYGGGLFFRLINKYYDLSPLKAIGIVDKQIYQKTSNIYGYKIYKPEDIKNLNPDYVVISTKKVLSIAESLYFDYIKDTDIQITPLVRKGFWATCKEV